jgi:hypothetical protein
MIDTGQVNDKIAITGIWSNPARKSWAIGTGHIIMIIIIIIIKQTPTNIFTYVYQKKKKTIFTHHQFKKNLKNKSENNYTKLE